MPLPETILVKYTEEEADYVSMRPLVRQNFRAVELVDMIVRVAGKDLGRVQQILRSGTVVFQSYRYWWQGFEGDPGELSGTLAGYPDAEPGRGFRAELCTLIMLEIAAVAKRHPVTIEKREAEKKAFWRRESFWDRLMWLARDAAPRYREYSYALQGDVYAASLSAAQGAELARDAGRLASRALRARIAGLPQVSQISFLCPRSGEALRGD